MQIFEEISGRAGGGFDLLEEIVHVGLRGPRGMPFWNMHCQGFGRRIIQTIQITEDNTGNVEGG